MTTDNYSAAGGPTDQYPAYGFVAHNLAPGAENERQQALDAKASKRAADEIDCDDYE